MVEEDVTDRAEWSVTGGLTPVEGSPGDYTVSEDEGDVTLSGMFQGVSDTAKLRIVGTLGELNVTATGVEGAQHIAVTPAAAANRLRLWHVDDAGKLPDVRYGTVLAANSNWQTLTNDDALYGTAGRVITIVDVDSTSRKARAKGSATLPAPLYGALTVTATPRLGGQTLAVAEPVGEGLMRRYKLSSEALELSYDQVCAIDDGWTSWPENGQIVGTEGQTATVVDCTVQGANLRKAGSVALPAAVSADLEYDAQAGEWTNWQNYYLARRDGKSYGVQKPTCAASNAPDWTKTGANANIANPVASTNDTAGDDPYQQINLFHNLEVNLTVDEDGVPHVTAIKGMVKPGTQADGFSRDGSAGDVFIIAPPLWYKFTIADNAESLDLSDSPLEGYTPMEGLTLPDGSLRPFLAYAKYAASRSDANPFASVSGAFTDNWFGSTANNRSAATAKGAGWSGRVQADTFYVQCMYLVKYATNQINDFGGCMTYNATAKLTAAMAASNRVPVAASARGSYYVGGRVTVTKRADGDRGDTGQAVAWYRLITDITVDGDTCWITVDGEPFDAVVDNVLTTMPPHTGHNDNVQGMDGYAYANVNKRFQPVLLQGIELFCGRLETDVDTIVKSVKDSDTQAHAELWRCWDVAGQNDTGEGMEKVGDYPATTKLDASDNFYLEDMTLSKGVFVPNGRSATSTTGLTDAMYTNPGTGNTYANRRFGALWNGVEAGWFFVYANSGLSSTWWLYGGRLSALGRSKAHA
ncbi:hypothetical protein G1C95_1056 [Bifidobacterium sp. DSM 109957]|uniref:Uncharacterized protein n=2 Tax=Bifidobacterium oedipodis TaxID=2675322 RepID=A0A7Y0EP45_9BIFI|nr:hypothetical protein [Bifidobacterium sp. DSM 109957]